VGGLNAGFRLGGLARDWGENLEGLNGERKKGLRGGALRFEQDLGSVRGTMTRPGGTVDWTDCGGILGVTE